ncbi:MAG: hypothetical protein OWQ57_02705 [Sulfobacillus sp.]|nr:hypothetical protein [Sulfobacillus sp.]
MLILCGFLRFTALYHLFWDSPTRATLTVCVGPAEIRVSPDFDPQWLQAVVRALTS